MPYALLISAVLISGASLAAEPPRWSKEDDSGACRSFLAGDRDAAQEALRDPQSFARDFRAYYFPDESQRYTLAMLALSQPERSKYVGNWFPLFKISRESHRTELFRFALKQNPSVLFYFNRFEISSPEYVDLVVDDLIRNPEAVAHLASLSLKNAILSEFAPARLETRARLWVALEEATGRR